MTRKGIWDLQEVRDKQLEGKWVADTNTLWVWGANNYGECGQNNRTEQPSPVQIPGTDWEQTQQQTTAPGGSHTKFCKKVDGTMWAWGQNSSGQLGINSQEDGRSSPTQIPGTNWAGVFAGEAPCLGVKTDGTLWSWGDNGRGGLGLNQPTSTKISSPTQIPGTNWAYGRGKICAGSSTCFAIKTDGTLWNWGDNEYGQLGLNNRTQYSSPRQVPGTTWDTVGGIYAQAIATKTDGTLWTWGPNESGRLGLNNRTSYSSPVQIPGTTWNRAYASSSTVIAFKDKVDDPNSTNKEMYIWGHNSYGAIGQNSPDNITYSSPIQMSGDWQSASAGFPKRGQAWMVLKGDGRLYGVGNAKDSCLGRFDHDIDDGSPSPYFSSPVQLSGTWWKSGSIQGGSDGGMAIKQDMSQNDV